MTESTSTSHPYHRSRRWPGRLLIGLGLLSLLTMATPTNTPVDSESTAFLAGYLMARLLFPLLLILWGSLLLRRDTKRRTQEPVAGSR